MYYQIMDPIVEENSNHNSFGFRLRRDIGDVIQQLTIFLDRPYTATKILDADISKCFEKIDHNAILKDGFQIIGFWIQKRKYHVDVFISKIYQRYKDDTECCNPRWTRITDLYLIRVALYQLSYGILCTSTTNFHIIIRHEMSNFYVNMTTYIYRLQPRIYIKWTKVHYKEGPLLVNEEHLEEHKDKHQFKYYK